MVIEWMVKRGDLLSGMNRRDRLTEDETSPSSWLRLDSAGEADNNLQFNNGSWTKASSTAIKLCLFSLMTSITLSHVYLKLPSIPLTSMAFLNILVNLNGIFSGNFSRNMATSKQSPKSMCNILPVSLCNIKLEGCLSPNPNIYPTIDITANDLVKFVRLSNHVC